MYILQAAKAYQDHCAKNGKPPTHAKAKELLYVSFVFIGEKSAHLRYSAACVGVGIDRLAETKGVSDL